MARPISEVTYQLPLKLVEESPGLALDIGSSIAKIVYRSNKDYSHGRPLVDSDFKYGQLHLALFPHDDLASVIEFLGTHCDIKREGDKPVDVAATGLGSALAKARIDQGLNVNVIVLPEFDCFVSTLTILSVELAREKFLLPTPLPALEEGKRIQALLGEWLQGSCDLHRRLNLGLHEKMTQENTSEHSLDDGRCIIVMCGSGTVVLLVDKDGSYTIVDGIYPSGRCFLGMTSVMTDEKDFGRLLELARTSDGRTVDERASDLLWKNDFRADENIYTWDNIDNLVFSFGKACRLKKEDIKRGDLVFSTLRTLSSVNAHIAELNCRLYNVRRAYFCGNFVDNDVVRECIIEAQHANLGRTFRGQDSRVELLFPRHSGMYGALGAYLTAL